MDLGSWLKVVEEVAPLILVATPLAPIAPYITLGIHTAEQIKGATSSQKLSLATQIANIGIAATNAQAGHEVVNPQAASEVMTESIDTIVAAANLKSKSAPSSTPTPAT